MTLNQLSKMKKIPKICGVYKITSPNNRVYIGSSSDIKTRFSFYKSGYTKTQWILKRSFDKYGIDAHTFEILEICEPEEKLKKERYYGDLFKSMYEFGGMNLKLPSSDDKPALYSKLTIDKFSELAKNRKYTKETLDKFSKARIGKYNDGKHPMAKILLNTETGIFYECLKLAALAHNINRSTLSMRMTGKNKNRTSLIYA